MGAAGSSPQLRLQAALRLSNLQRVKPRELSPGKAGLHRMVLNIGGIRDHDYQETEV